MKVSAYTCENLVLDDKVFKGLGEKISRTVIPSKEMDEDSLGSSPEAKTPLQFILLAMMSQIEVSQKKLSTLNPSFINEIRHHISLQLLNIKFTEIVHILDELSQGTASNWFENFLRKCLQDKLKLSPTSDEILTAFFMNVKNIYQQIMLVLLNEIQKNAQQRYQFLKFFENEFLYADMQPEDQKHLRFYIEKAKFDDFKSEIDDPHKFESIKQKAKDFLEIYPNLGEVLSYSKLLWQKVVIQYELPDLIGFSISLEKKEGPEIKIELSGPLDQKNSRTTRNFLKIFSRLNLKCTGDKKRYFLYLPLKEISAFNELLGDKIGASSESEPGPELLIKPLSTPSLLNPVDIDQKLSLISRPAIRSEVDFKRLDGDTKPEFKPRDDKEFILPSSSQLKKSKLKPKPKPNNSDENPISDTPSTTPSSTPEPSITRDSSNLSHSEISTIITTSPSTDLSPPRSPLSLSFLTPRRLSFSSASSEDIPIRGESEKQKLRILKSIADKIKATDFVVGFACFGGTSTFYKSKLLHHQSKISTVAANILTKVDDIEPYSKEVQLSETGMTAINECYAKVKKALWENCTTNKKYDSGKLRLRQDATQTLYDELYEMINENTPSQHTTRELK